MSDKIVCVAGPTGCGKTRLAILLAQRFHGEVISADSMQIYRGMSIVSAAPTAEEMQGVPHHMIGVADPSEAWSAAKYVETVVPVIDDVLRRGYLPILAGGTGLWMEAAVRGEVFAPGHSGGQVRQELETRFRTEGITPLLEELSRVDPESAARLHPSDTKRILRALEVWYETGQTLSAYHEISRQRPPRYGAVWLGVRYKDRECQRRRLRERVDEMARAGLLEEIRTLAETVPPEATALQAIGCKELLPVVSGEKSYADGLEEIRIHTCQYAKRQLTWLRRNPEIHWIEWEDFQNFPYALQNSTSILAEYGICL